MKTLNCLLLSVAIIISTAASAQTGPIDRQVVLDSLYAVWQDDTQADSARADAYRDYVKSFLYIDPDSAFSLAEGLVVFADEREYPIARVQAYLLQGASSLVKGNYPEAFEFGQRSLKLSEEVGYKRGVSSALNNMGGVYVLQGAIPQALDLYQRSLKLEEEIGDKEGIAGSLNNIGGIYYSQAEFDKALVYYQRSLTISEAIKDEEGIADALVRIGSIRAYQGAIPQALEHYQRGLKVYEAIGDELIIGNLLLQIGGIQAHQGAPAEAMESFDRSLKIAKRTGDRRGMINALNNIGLLYKAQGLNALAIDECGKGLELSKEIGVIDLEQLACFCLYEAHKAMGHASKALEYYERMTVLKDSLFSAENTKKLTRLEMQYTFDEQEAATRAEQEKKDAIAAQELKRHKLVRNGFIGGFAVVLLFAGVFFTQRNRIGKEKARSEALLLNILPEEVAEELKAKGAADAVQIDQVTVLFTDFKGFTAMSEKLTPRDLVMDLHECFSAFDHICEKYGIEKIKTIGDAYMAAGGLPTPNTTHATDVINAALAMRDFIAEGRARKIAAGLPFFEIRIGVHTGPVVAGIVGVKKFQYDIWGDTVNTASRMESSGEVGQVNISEATYELVKEEPDLLFTPRGKVHAKGKGDLEMYFVDYAPVRVRKTAA